ncbi:uncharacterized protein LOC141850026 [Brevipalpus obovatus]|uniref:uncharacterized protein LOC141850026 n=1 Tax=Brevipalpus obovatus TaxID=246614 RepID=UPI003D9DC46B
MYSFIWNIFWCICACLVSKISSEIPPPPGIPRSRTYHGGDTDGNYSFGYTVHEPSGVTKFRQEAGGHNGARHGSYGLSEDDNNGARRIVVNYSTKPRSVTQIYHHPQTNPSSSSSFDLESPGPSRESQWSSSGGSSPSSGIPTLNPNFDLEDADHYTEPLDDGEGNVREYRLDGAIQPKSGALWNESWEKKQAEYNHQERGQDQHDPTSPSDMDGRIHEATYARSNLISRLMNERRDELMD